MQVRTYVVLSQVAIEEQQMPYRNSGINNVKNARPKTSSSSSCHAVPSGVNLAGDAELRSHSGIHTHSLATAGLRGGQRTKQVRGADAAGRRAGPLGKSAPKRRKVREAGESLSGRGLNRGRNPVPPNGPPSGAAAEGVRLRDQFRPYGARLRLPAEGSPHRQEPPAAGEDGARHRSARSGPLSMGLRRTPTAVWNLACAVACSGPRLGLCRRMQTEGGYRGVQGGGGWREEEEEGHGKAAGRGERKRSRGS